MKSSLLRRFVRQTLTEAYSLGLVNSLKKKFKEEQPELTDQVIEDHIKIFDQNKDGRVIRSHPNKNDILKYTWSELESVVDNVLASKPRREAKIEGDLEPVYKSPDGTLQIFLGDRREKCVSIRQDFERRSGERYSWCISRSDSSNMFASYRFRMNEPVFYYVFDSDRDKSDPLHACVIYVTPVPGRSDEVERYYVSDARNMADRNLSWQTIVNEMPKLSNLKSIFKPIPLTQKERDLYEITRIKASDEKYASYSRELKEAYIGIGHLLTPAQIRSSFETDKDLVNKYCNTQVNVLLPVDIYEQMPESTKRVIDKNFDTTPIAGRKFSREVYDLLYKGQKDFDDLRLHQVNLRDLNFKLPDNMTVKGLLYMHETVLDELPKNLKVGGDLFLDESTIKSIPSGLEVGGSLSLASTEISTLPPDMKVSGGISLSMTKIKELQIKEVSGYLSLTDSPIERLPEGLKVGGSLHLGFTYIEKLPKNLKVKGSLNLESTPIRLLPPDLEVGENITLNNSDIVKLPPGFSVKGTLSMINTMNLVSLPEGLTVGGDLNLGRSSIKKLPDNMKIGEYLLIGSTPIKTLPRGLFVGKSIELEGTSISSLPDDIQARSIYGNSELDNQLRAIKAERKVSESVLKSFIRSFLT